ncbi:hypothetical protein BH11PAT2_BH11PAT2_03340 [soil metagenome]
MQKYALLLGLALCAGTSSPTLAQSSTDVNYYAYEHCNYVVRPGDSLWRIAGRNLPNPNQWKWIYNNNPRLKLPGVRTVRHNGTVYVMIHPGDRLCGIDEFGHLTMPTPVATATPTATATESFRDRPASIFANANEWWWTPLWLLLLIPLWLLLWLYEELKKDPVRSGRAQRPGGIHNLEEARRAFEERPMRQHFEILNMVAGRGYGIAGVRYADGITQPRILDGEVMYRATIRRANGSLDDLYTIMACGNDIQASGASSWIPGVGFRFVPDAAVAEEAAPVATPEQAPVAEEPVLEPAAAVESVAEPAPSEATVDDGKVLIELKRATGELPSMLRLKGIDVSDVTLTIGDRETTIRFTETPPRSTRKAK